MQGVPSSNLGAPTSQSHLPDLQNQRERPVYSSVYSFLRVVLPSNFLAPLFRLMDSPRCYPVHGFIESLEPRSS